MNMKRCRTLAAMLALVLAASMGIGCFAEESTLETRYSLEETSALVEALFAAAAGTDVEAERAFRKENTAEEYAQHRAELAEYRRQTLPWVMEAFTPETDVPEEDTLPTAEPTLAPVEEETWQIEDGYKALEGTQVGRVYIELLRSYGFDGAQACMQGTREICGAWLTELNTPALKEMNSDYACWLYGPGTQIDYPVVQCDDNEYYLKRMFNGERNSAGTLFIDYRNLPAFQDPNTLIYGHHMRNGSMFKSITYYKNQEWYESHPFMLLIAESEIAIIELVASYRTTSKDHCYDIAISDETDLMNFALEAKKKSDFETEAEIKPGDRLVTLSTCAYEYDGARCIAIGRLESVWQDEQALERIMTAFEDGQLLDAHQGK